MIYKDFEIVANTKSYDLYSLDNEGRLEYLKHSFEGADVISYTYTNNDDVLDGEFGDFETIEKCKKAIDDLRSK